MVLIMKGEMPSRSEIELFILFSIGTVLAVAFISFWIAS